MTEEILLALGQESGNDWGPDLNLADNLQMAPARDLFLRESPKRNLLRERSERDLFLRERSELYHYHCRYRLRGLYQTHYKEKSYYNEDIGGSFRNHMCTAGVLVRRCRREILHSTNGTDIIHLYMVVEQTFSYPRVIKNMLPTKVPGVNNFS